MSRAGTDNDAVINGYTRHVLASSPHGQLCILIHPDTDLDGSFPAFDTDEQEWIRVYGWLYVFEDC